MNRNEIRRKALLAANSVVLAFAAGCVPQGVAIVLDPPSASGADTDSDTVDTDGDYAYVIDTDTAPIESAEPQCAGLDGEAVWRCCEERAIWCQDNVADSAVDECLFGPGYNGETGCIPWGPPAPPRLGAFTGVGGVLCGAVA